MYRRCSSPKVGERPQGVGTSSAPDTARGDVDVDPPSAGLLQGIPERSPGEGRGSTGWNPGRVRRGRAPDSRKPRGPGFDGVEGQLLRGRDPAGSPPREGRPRGGRKGAFQKSARGRSRAQRSAERTRAEWSRLFLPEGADLLFWSERSKRQEDYVAKGAKAPLARGTCRGPIEGRLALGAGTFPRPFRKGETRS
jgi:hypothetical protein